MKLNSLLKVMAVPALAAILFAGCSGATGPEGPQGTPGNDGVANISATTVPVTAWSGSEPAFYADFTFGAITSDASDLVVVYFVNNTGAYMPLPVSPGVATNDYLSFTFNTNALNLSYYDPSGSPTGTWVFNVIVVPPAAMKQHPNTNWHDYTQVKAVLDMQASLKN